MSHPDRRVLRAARKAARDAAQGKLSDRERTLCILRAWEPYGHRDPTQAAVLRNLAVEAAAARLGRAR